jgi:hypothetical protein
MWRGSWSATKLLEEKCLMSEHPWPALKPGAFYWALPVLDPDTDEEWQNQPQPARYVGLTPDCLDMWVWLGVEGVSEWPARWVGKEIVQT